MRADWPGLGWGLGGAGGGGGGVGRFRGEKMEAGGPVDRSTLEFCAVEGSKFKSHGSWQRCELRLWARVPQGGGCCTWAYCRGSTTFLVGVLPFEVGSKGRTPQFWKVSPHACDIPRPRPSFLLLGLESLLWLSVQPDSWKIKARFRQLVLVFSSSLPAGVLMTTCAVTTPATPLFSCSQERLIQEANSGAFLRARPSLG